MLEFSHVVNSSDLSNMHNFDTEDSSSNRRFKLASSMINEFFNDILSDTMSNPKPKTMYYFDIDDGIDLKDLRNILDDIMYRLFKQNIYAMPEVFFKESTDHNTQSRILIHAVSTVKSILTADNRLEKEMEDVLCHHVDFLQEGKAVLYTNFNHVVSILPDMYSSSRIGYIKDLLDKKGYNTEYDDTSMVFSITTKL